MMRPKNATELGKIDVELKEAICDALVNMITQRSSGSDEAGRVVYGKSPSRSVFSGQLLPRLRADVDETSDIRIAAIGIDFNMDAAATCTLEVKPKFSIYVRVLPTWEEISSDRYGIPIDFKIRKDKKAEIDKTIRERREEIFQRENLSRPDWGALDPDQKESLKRRRTEIQDDIRKNVYAEYGIPIDGADGLIFNKPEISESEEENITTPAESPEATTEFEANPDLGRLVTSGATIPESMYSPAPIPPKWIRIDLDLPTCTWAADIHGDALKSAFAEYSASMQPLIRSQIDDWCNAGGDKILWRDRTVTQADAASEASWNSFTEKLGNAPVEPKVFPNLNGVVMRAERQRDFMNPERVSMRLTLDNSCAELSKTDARFQCNSIFGTGFTLRLDRNAHRPVKLDRVEPSYRFRDYMAYPAIGLNCGVEENEPAEDVIELKTTWAPRFSQPRVVPRKIDLEYRFRPLADGYDVEKLHVLVEDYRAWINQQEVALKDLIIRELSTDDADRERARFAEDLAGQRAEARHIELGIEILVASRKAFLAATNASGPERERLIRRSAPWRAWLMMNESFARRDAKHLDRGWRLFQLAFILAHIPTFASRIEEFSGFFDADRDEMSASLLYFPTGGGKSEAFYGALVFSIFLDRLRGKNRGITAMIRYPLRLLTLQQAQRLLKLTVWSEIVRKEMSAGSWPIEIGFWVGASNTPNRFSHMRPDLPDLGTDADGDSLATGNSSEAKRYQDVQASYNKVPSCPCCGGSTGLRRHRTVGGKERAVIVCFDKSCEWNKAHGGVAPLPFLLTDDTIYQRAPAILLGTVDKLAMLGQSTQTITDILGMFGLARWIGPDGHLANPREQQDLSKGPSSSGASAVYPAYDSGERVFYDPFPSLIIQDEAHLLEESLGTFSGLFDSLLEKTFSSIDDICGSKLNVARYRNEDGQRVPRLPKIIAATATISDPERQIKTLYQRKPLRYPYPGPDIYRSFFSEPEQAPRLNSERSTLSLTMPHHLAPEATSPLMRLYVSLMTNGATHTVTTVGVLGSFHTIITHLWQDLLEPTKAQAAVAEIAMAVSPGRAGAWRRAAIQRAVDDGRTDEIMALIDLHRIALAYVTNKKGGDQVIDALHTAVSQKHLTAGLPHDVFVSRLISGGIDMQEIQAVMKLAETSFGKGHYPDVGETLRNIVATSAISHGVDVDRFNSMFFAGLPSDVAEYIQASSRVGRTHVGFVMLLPTPQSRRDRYVVETHDIFHRFLERMIAPPAVERWSELAIDRVRPSYVQTWAMLKDARDFIGLPDHQKSEFLTHDSTKMLNKLSRRDTVAFADELGSFMLEAMGIGGRGADGIGAPTARDFYRARTDAAALALGRSMKDLDISARLRQFWEEQDSKLQMPMTSLRDVDEAGLIRASDFDRGSRGHSREMSLEDVATAMKIIRRQRGDTSETDMDFDHMAGD
ncbi:DEAD/DEAH box helicase family protein [Neorhizobium petrolearium]|uniref:Helicase-related protein n=1 Tax=Neorhizobium petrolearium TaxID=515361 RepID=A0ABY8M8U6_9HYPH|nr:helicase-related protein [Neorhizobium petrolearium]MCC2610852.1 helicase [Neorhizobium petrolearium]WGI70967.1 helicase-related protein [Neorhizobium petrolearium]